MLTWTKLTLLAVPLCVCTLAIDAQMAAPAGPAGPAAEAQRYYAGAKKNILASADKMPADGYGFRPEPDIRTYARVLNHIAEAQLHTCGAFNGTPADKVAKVPAETASKDEIDAALKASFAECDKAFAALTDSNLTEMVQAGPAKRSRIGMLWGINAHNNEQYATLALYLRLKGLTPPSSEK